MSILTAENKIQKDDAKSSKILALSSLFTAIFAMAFAAILIRLSSEEISPYAIIFHHFWIALIALILWIAAKNVWLYLRGETEFKEYHYDTYSLILLVATGGVLLAWNMLWAFSLMETSVSSSTLLHNSTSIFTALAGWLIWGRRLDARFGIGMVLALGGATGLELRDVHISLDHLLGDLAAFLSAIFYAANLMLMEFLRYRFPATIIVLWSCSIAALLSIPILWLTGGQIFPSSWQVWFYVSSLGVICQLLGQGLVAYSLRTLSSTLVSLSDLLDPVLTSIGAWIILNESLSLFDWIAFFVVLSGLYFSISSQSATNE